MRIFPRVDKLFNVAEKSKPSNLVFPIGIDIFDNAMDGGVREGELIVVSGPTGQGKTTFLQNLTINCHVLEVPSIWFTYEMDPWYLKEKFVSMGQDKHLLAYAPNDNLEGRISFIEERIVEGNEEYLTKIVFIDHLHYLIPMDSVQNSSLMIGGIARALKQLAIKTKSIIFLIAHTKKIYQDEKLDLSSIRDSSLIVQEADYVFLVERLKNEEKKVAKLRQKIQEENTQWSNKSKIELAKNRRTGIMVYKTFELKDNRFIYNNEDTRTIEKLQDNRRKSKLSSHSKRSSKNRRKLFDSD